MTMDSFAAKGLRTLMFASKKLEENVDVAAIPEEDLENDLNLLGVTGLEDILQDKVKNCIQDFKDARIKVWMISGDKQETAHQVSIHCGIIDSVH
mmetsp:Transcript_24250/g.37390  ORF Transcript_24250/g.37390 Transcript_24250/m.37390 type:complete len:95 (+) Transcript_24250:1738-2022(+)